MKQNQFRISHNHIHKRKWKNLIQFASIMAFLLFVDTFLRRYHCIDFIRDCQIVYFVDFCVTFLRNILQIVCEVVKKSLCLFWIFMLPWSEAQSIHPTFWVIGVCFIHTTPFIAIRIIRSDSICTPELSIPTALK